MGRLVSGAALEAAVKEFEPMKNFVQERTTVTVATPANVSSGQLLLVGSIVGVATSAAGNGTSTVNCLWMPTGQIAPA
jgi:hypothetical protein